MQTRHAILVAADTESIFLIRTVTEDTDRYGEIRRYGPRHKMIRTKRSGLGVIFESLVRPSFQRSSLRDWWSWFRPNVRQSNSEDFIRWYTSSLHMWDKIRASPESWSVDLWRSLFLLQSTCSIRISVNHAQDELLTPPELRDTLFPAEKLKIPVWEEIEAPDLWIFSTKNFQKKYKKNFFKFCS